MKRSQIVNLLHIHRTEIVAYGVKSLALFGSVEFSRPVGLFKFIDLKQYLEELLGCPVDLGTPNSLQPRMKDHVIQEAIYVI
jgi:predicted nucleotidyltransferase